MNSVHRGLDSILISGKSYNEMFVSSLLSQSDSSNTTTPERWNSFKTLSISLCILCTILFIIFLSHLPYIFRFREFFLPTGPQTKTMV